MPSRRRYSRLFAVRRHRRDVDQLWALGALIGGSTQADGRTGLSVAHDSAFPDIIVSPCTAVINPLPR